MKGSIIQRGNRLFIVYDAPRSPGEKRRQIWRRVEGTRRDAERALARALADAGEGKAPTKDTTLEDLLTDWLEWVSDHVQPKTLRGYEDICNLHLIPALGSRLLSTITEQDIESYLRGKGRAGRLDKKGGLSARSVQAQHRVLSMALKRAVRWKLLPSNPAENVSPPPLKRPEARTLDAAGAEKLLAEAAETGLYLPILLAVSTGMRRGEVCGLRWQDVDLDAGVITVRHAAKVRSGEQGQEWYLGPPKAGKSGGVSIPPSLAAVLREVRGSEKPSAFVIQTPEGGMVPPDRLTGAFRRLMKRLDLGITFHSLRHSHSTILLAQGVDIKTISEQLRHGRISTTMDVYGHVLPVTRAAAALAFDAALEQAKKTRSNRQTLDFVDETGT